MIEEGLRRLEVKMADCNIMRDEVDTPIARLIGNYVSDYHWQEGIGPLSDRPKRSKSHGYQMNPICES